MVQPWVQERPHTAYLYPTLLCNLHCEMCYSGSHQSRERAKEEMTLADYERIIPQLYDIGVRTFDISGGEPFLSKDIFALFRMIKSYPDTKLLVVNNGTRLRAVMPELEKHLDLIDRMYISIDSPVAEEHNKIRGNARALEESLAGMKAVQATGFDRLGTNMVVMRQNQHRVKEALTFAHAQGFRYVNLLRLIDVKQDGTTQEDNADGRGMDRSYLDALEWLEAYADSGQKEPMEITMVFPGGFYEAYRKSPKRRNWPDGISLKVEFDPIRGCPAFGNSVIVSSTGEVTGCTAFITQQPFYTGNAKEMTMEESLASWSEQRDRLREREQFLKTQEPCKGCEHWQMCRGGCPATAYKYYGTIMRSDPTCVKALEKGIVPPEPTDLIHLEDAR
ncbi:radical SAM protein [Tumebacillus sp. DT12]|uniref:Radical SAM protein n=1 Tax=Tumebacillus lacus TaxID=2995335 RepID=A0ABT3X017_9BACL|nr:radical SAM protein [Tumebacillus lacus]MCX7570238.1 radical SAM protein [Tumebacillus lacus]